MVHWIQARLDSYFKHEPKIKLTIERMHCIYFQCKVWIVCSEYDITTKRASPQKISDFFSKTDKYTSNSASVLSCFDSIMDKILKYSKFKIAD